MVLAKIMCLLMWLAYLGQFTDSIQLPSNSKYCNLKVDLQNEGNIIKICWEPTLEEMRRDMEEMAESWNKMPAAVLFVWNIIVSNLFFYFIVLLITHGIVLIIGIAIGYATGLLSREYLSPEINSTPEKSNRVKGSEK